MNTTNSYLLLAREVLTDASDNMNSIIKIIDKFTFGIDKNKLAMGRLNLPENQIPALPVSYAIASAWFFNEDLTKDTIVRLRITVIDPDGKDLGGPEQEHLVPKNQSKISMNFISNALPVTKSGIYKLIAKLSTPNGKELGEASYPFEVELINAITQA